MRRIVWRWLAAAIVVLVAFAVRVHGLSRASLWTDEGGTVFAVRQNLAGTVSYLLEDAVHPPLFFLAQEPAFLLGDTEFVMRLPAALFGLLMVAGVMRLGRDWAGLEAGMLAAAFLAVSPFAVWYSREVRMYSLLALLTVGAMWGFGQLLSETLFSRVKDAGFVLVSAALYLTHYFGLFIPLVQFAYLLLTFRRNHRWLAHWAALQFMAGLPLGVWMLVQYRHGVTLKIAWIQPPQFSDLLRTLISLTAGGSLAWQWAVGAVAGATAMVGVWSLRRGQGRLLGLWILLPALVAFAISVQRPLYVERYFIGSLPALMFAMASGVMSISRRSRPLALVLAMLLLGAMGWQSVAAPDHHREDWRAAVQFIDANLVPGDLLLRRSVFYRAMDYYYHGEAPLLSMDADWQAESLAALQGKRLWLVYIVESEGATRDKTALVADIYGQAPDGITLDWLKRLEPYLREWHDFDGVVVLMYEPWAQGAFHGR